MAKVVLPLMSLAASGTFGNILTFVCGLYARIAQKKKEGSISPGQGENQTKWSDGCKVWQTLGNNKELWSKFAKLVKEKSECDIKYAFYMTGFQTFMCYYMDLGLDGWPNYPLPPN